MENWFVRIENCKTSSSARVLLGVRFKCQKFVSNTLKIVHTSLVLL
jgi:hypothetical protein